MLLESSFYVGQWLVESELNRVSADGCEKTLVPKVMKLLQVLASEPGRSFSQDELIEKVWSGQVVSDSSVYQAVAQLRKALGDKSAEPKYLERVSGKGYRLIAHVKPYHPETGLVKTVPNFKLMLSAILLVSLVVFSVIFVLLNQPSQPSQPSQSSQTNYTGSNDSSVRQNSPLKLEDIATISLIDLTLEQQDLPIEITGINDILLTQLTHVDGLRVVHLKTNQIKPETEAVIRGKINRQKEQIRVFLQLEQVSTKEVIWAKVFDGNLNDLFSLQDAIVNDLLHLFNKRQSSKTFDLSKLDKVSFDQYLLARHLWRQRNTFSLLKAQKIFETMKLESRLFPLAAVGLCDTYHFLHLYSDWKLETVLEKCGPLLEKALTQQPNLGEALAAKGFLLTSQNKEVEAKRFFEKAIKLSPNYAFAYLWYGNLIREMGLYPEALEMTQKAFDLSPMSPVINRSLAYSYLNLRRVLDARYYYERSLTLDPDYSYRPVGELDFLELNIERARAFLNWASANEAEMQKHLNSQLTASQVHLSLGNTAYVRKVFKALEGKIVNPSFLLYMKASLAAAEQNTELAERYLKQRLMMHQDNERFVMPYISALIENKSLEQALSVFSTYMPYLTKEDVQINKDNQFQLASLAQLQSSLGLNNPSNQLIHKLDVWFLENKTAVESSWLAEWKLFRNEKAAAQSILVNLMSSGWLPDYNAEVFPVIRMKRLFAKAGLGEQRFEELLAANRAKVFM